MNMCPKGNISYLTQLVSVSVVLFLINTADINTFRWCRLVCVGCHLPGLWHVVNSQTVHSEFEYRNIVSAT